MEGEQRDQRWRKRVEGGSEGGGGKSSRFQKVDYPMMN